MIKSEGSVKVAAVVGGEQKDEEIGRARRRGEWGRSWGSRG